MNWFKGLIIALIISYLIAMFWEFIEYLQFGKLKVTEFVTVLFMFCILWLCGLGLVSGRRMNE